MSVYSNLVIADGASSFWRLNEPSGTTAVDVIGGKNGTISGGVTLNQPGALSDGDKAMGFDGTNGRIQTAASVAMVVPVTIEAWFKTGSTATQFLLSNRSGNTGDQVLLYVQAGPLTCYVHYAGTSSPDQNLAIAARSDGQWHHWVVTLTTATVRQYVDGIEQVGSPFTLPAPYTGQLYSLAIGGESGGVSLNGSLDDVAIYPSALSPAQIAAHYQARLLSGSRRPLPAFVLAHRRFPS